MAPIDLYCVPGSPPCRAVRLAAKAVGVELNLKLTDLMKGENLKPEFVKLNPQHTIPTLNDNGFVLWESRAIMTYFVNQYGKDDSLYPKDPKTRARVDQKLYFDLGLYQRYSDYFYPQLFAKAPADPAKLEKLQEALGWLDGYLSESDYVVGNTLTIADFSLVATVSTIEICKIDISSYKNIARWYNKVKATAPGYVELNEKPNQEFEELIETFKNKK